MKKLTFCFTILLQQEEFTISISPENQGEIRTGELLELPFGALLDIANKIHEISDGADGGDAIAALELAEEELGALRERNPGPFRADQADAQIEANANPTGGQEKLRAVIEAPSPEAFGLPPRQHDKPEAPKASQRPQTARRHTIETIKEDPSRKEVAPVSINDLRRYLGYVDSSVQSKIRPFVQAIVKFAKDLRMEVSLSEFHQVFDEKSGERDINADPVEINHAMRLFERLLGSKEGDEAAKLIGWCTEEFVEGQNKSVVRILVSLTKSASQNI